MEDGLDGARGADGSEDRPPAPPANTMPLASPGCLSTIGTLLAVISLLLFGTLPYVGVLIGGLLGFFGALASGFGIAAALAEHRAIVREMPWARAAGGAMLFGALALVGNVIAFGFAVAFITS